MNRIKCDNCGFTFDLSKAKLRKQKLKDDIEQTSFICPKCKKKYVVITTNTVIRKLIQKRKALSGYAKERNNEEFVKKMNEYKAIGEEIKSKSRELTAAVEAGNGTEV